MSSPPKFDLYDPLVPPSFHEQQFEYNYNSSMQSSSLVNQADLQSSEASYGLSDIDLYKYIFRNDDSDATSTYYDLPDDLAQALGIDNVTLQNSSWSEGPTPIEINEQQLQQQVAQSNPVNLVPTVHNDEPPHRYCLSSVPILSDGGMPIFKVEKLELPVKRKLLQRLNIEDGRNNQSIRHNDKPAHICPIRRYHKQISTADNWKEHCRLYDVHEDDKPYRCPSCYRTYLYIANTKRHMRNHSAVQKFICYICDKRFFRNDYLQAHMKNVCKELQPNSADPGPGKKSIDLQADLQSGEAPYGLSDIDLYKYIFQNDDSDATLTYYNVLDDLAQLLVDDNVTLQGSYPQVESASIEISKQQQQQQVAQSNPVNLMPTYYDLLDDLVQLLGDDNVTVQNSSSAVEPGSIEISEQQISESNSLEMPAKCKPRQRANISGHICPFPGCYKQFDRADNMKRHSWVHRVPKENQPLHCPSCKKSFARKDHLKKHMTTHSGVRKSICYICDRKFICSDYLQAHIKKVHKNPQPNIANPDPEKESIENSRQQQQQRQIGPNNPANLMTTVKNAKPSPTPRHYPNPCASAMPISEANNSEMVVIGPNGKTRHICPFFGCYKQFGRADNLNRHFWKHDRQEEVKPFHCPLCKWRFGRKDHLKLHIELHSDTKKFICYICNKEFIRNDYLQAHMRKVHKKPQPSSAEPEPGKENIETALLT